MAGEKIGREELHDCTTGNKQKAIKPLQSAPENSLKKKKKKGVMSLGYSENEKVFCSCTSLYSTSLFSTQGRLPTQMLR